MSRLSVISTALAFSLLLSIADSADAANRYVSTSGSDSNNGTQSSPWRTIDHAIAASDAGDTILVANGQYSGINETTSSGRGGYLTIKAASEHGATVAGITLSYGSLTNSYLRFEDLVVYKVNTTGGLLVNINYARNVELNNLRIHSSRYGVASGEPGNPQMMHGIRVYNSETVIVERAEIFEVNRGGQVQDTNGFELRNSYIAMKGGSGWQNLYRNTNTVFLNNHWHGSDGIPWPGGWERYPDDPQGPSATYAHASMISNRSGSITIRGNYFHGFGSSSGLMWYDEPSVAPPYSDIVLENNLIYDTGNAYAIRLYQPGRNIRIRNNLVFSRYRTDVNSCEYILSTALMFHNQPTVPSSVEIHNNIFLGSASFPSGAQESNNIVWASLGLSVSSPSGVPGFDAISANGTLVAKTGGTCGQDHKNVFEVAGQFFANPPNFLFPSNSHGDWRLASGSVGINYGNASKQANVSLGSLDSNGKFLLNDGVARSSTIRSVGPIEASVGAAVPRLAPPAQH